MASKTMVTSSSAKSDVVPTPSPKGSEPSKEMSGLPPNPSGKEDITVDPLGDAVVSKENDMTSNPILLAWTEISRVGNGTNSANIDTNESTKSVEITHSGVSGPSMADLGPSGLKNQKSTGSKLKTSKVVVNVKDKFDKEHENLPDVWDDSYADNHAKGVGLALKMNFEGVGTRQISFKGL